MKLHRYKTQGKKGLFDEQNSISLLSEIGNPLEMVSKVIDFEMFRSTLENKLLNTNKKNNAGAKPFDVVLMFNPDRFCVKLQMFFIIFALSAAYASQLREQSFF